jgi:hypothetical protein
LFLGRTTDQTEYEKGKKTVVGYKFGKTLFAGK